MNNDHGRSRQVVIGQRYFYIINMENGTPKYWSLLAGGLYLEAVVSLGLTVGCVAYVSKSNDFGLRFEKSDVATILQEAKFLSMQNKCKVCSKISCFRSTNFIYSFVLRGKSLTYNDDYFSRPLQYIVMARFSPSGSSFFLSPSH